MPQNPFTDIWQFLIGATDDHHSLGSGRYLLVVLFLALLVGSVFFAARNWSEDPSQRTFSHVATWILRALIGSMWFQGMLWKLPLPVSDGLRYWLEQEGTRAAFAFHRDLVNDFLLPHLAWFGPLVFLAELMFSASLILGLGVRFVSVVAIAFVLQLWLGIYLPGSPAEWTWSYLFLAMMMFMFAHHAAGRSLGADAWLRRHVPAVREGKGLVGRFFNLAG